jgi:hypothetical protein
MPLEIRELVIKVSVNEKNGSAQQWNDELNQKLLEMKTKVVKECIEKIMDRIGKISER